MEKRLRSSLQSSAEEFLASATKLSLKSSRSALKTLIHGVQPSSDLTSSLPPCLYHSISQSLNSFKNLLEPSPIPNPNPIRSPTKSPRSPPTKRPRRSSRRPKAAEEPVPENNHEMSADDLKQKILQKIQMLAYILRLCVLHPKSAFSPLDLLPGVQALHDNLILFESDWVFSTEIAVLCEEWWKEGLTGKESLISQSLPFLLSRSLTLKKKQDVHRVYALREAFILFDFVDESIEDLKQLLLRCVISPLYLKTEEGKRFIAFMFGLSTQLLKEMLAMIRSQIPFGRKSMLEAYGDVVFRAWKVAEGEYREEIENGFMQGLLEGAMYASLAAFAASIRRVLGVFIIQRTTNGVEKLLFRLAEPVIFRSLQVANSNVRQNALHLLLDLFPLEDPDSTKEVKDTLLDKQFYLLEKLLMDDCPDIRVVAVEGCCRLLRLFWEVIPSPTITKVLTKIFDDMSHDLSNEVRLSTLNGIIYLFGNPHSHEVLKVILPRLDHLILDNTLSIRLAMADLLLLIRDLRNFQFNKVVDLDVLLSTLVNDQLLVAQKITRLLMPSYFPSKTPIVEACNRCVTLMKRSPTAGARFCEFAALEGASPNSLMELVRVFISLVCSPGKLKADLVEGLFLAVAHLSSTLSSEPNYLNALKELFSGQKLKCLLSVTSTRRAKSSLFDIAATISVGNVARLLDECIGLITNCSGLSEDKERQSEVRSAQKLLLSCGRFNDMFEALTSILQRVAYRCHIKFGSEIPQLSVFSPKRKGTKSSGKFSTQWKHVSAKKPSIFEEDYSLAVDVSWQIKDLLQSEDARKAILESQSLESSFIALKVISEVSILHCTHFESTDAFPVLAYTDLSLHITLQNVGIGILKDCHAKKNNISDCSGSSAKTMLSETLGHILNCTEKLFRTGSDKSGKSPSLSKQSSNKSTHRHKEMSRESNADAAPISNGGTVRFEPKSLLRKVKTLTAVLKFMVDATAMDLVNCDERCLTFASCYLCHVTHTLGQQPHDSFQFEEEDVKDIVLCLKSSFTYAAKLLSLTLKDTTEVALPPARVFNLANDLIDQITTIELYFGSGYAARVLAAAKSWLPDFILALGYGHIHKQIQKEGTTSTTACIKIQFPTWLSVLGKTELSELNNSGIEEDDNEASELGEFPAFKKLLGMIVVLSSRNPCILDAIGEIFLIGSVVGLEKKDYGMVLGLLHFLCVKLFRPDDREWGDLMLASLQDICPQIERHMENESDEDGRRQLEHAWALLEPIWLYHIYETGKVSVMEE